MTYLNSQPPEELSPNELAEQMPIERRKELEGIVNQLDEIRAQIRQIRVADSLSGLAQDKRLADAFVRIRVAGKDLRDVISANKGS